MSADVDAPKLAYWAFVKGQRSQLSRQDAVSSSSTPDSTPRILSPADAYTPCSPGMPVFWVKGFTGASQESLDGKKAVVRTLTQCLPHPSLSPASTERQAAFRLQKSSSSIAARPEMTNQLGGTNSYPSVNQSGACSNAHTSAGSHLSRSKSHPYSHVQQNLEDINLFDPYPRERFNRGTLDSMSDESLQTGNSSSSASKMASLQSKQTSDSTDSNGQQTNTDKCDSQRRAGEKKPAEDDSMFDFQVSETPVQYFPDTACISIPSNVESPTRPENRIAPKASNPCSPFPHCKIPAQDCLNIRQEFQPQSTFIPPLSPPPYNATKRNLPQCTPVDAHRLSVSFLSIPVPTLQVPQLALPPRSPMVVLPKIPALDSAVAFFPTNTQLITKPPMSPLKVSTKDSSVKVELDCIPLADGRRMGMRHRRCSEIGRTSAVYDSNESLSLVQQDFSDNAAQEGYRNDGC